MTRTRKKKKAVPTTEQFIFYSADGYAHFSIMVSGPNPEKRAYWAHFFCPGHINRFMATIYNIVVRPAKSEKLDGIDPEDGYSTWDHNQFKAEGPYRNSIMWRRKQFKVAMTDPTVSTATFSF